MRVDLLQLFTPGAPTPGKPADDGVDRVARDEAREEEVQQQGHEEDHEGPGHLAAEYFASAMVPPSLLCVR